MLRLIMGVVTAGFLFLGLSAGLCSERPEPQDKPADRLETIATWKMLERLDLDQPTAEKMLDLRRKFVSHRKDIKKELEQDFQKLRSLLKDETSKANDKEIAQVLQNIREKRKRLQMMMDEQFAEVSKVLSVRKQAELVIFFKDFHQEIRSLIRPPAGRPLDRGTGPKGNSGRDGAIGPSVPFRPGLGMGTRPSMTTPDAGTDPDHRLMRPGLPEPAEGQDDFDEATTENS